MILISKYVVPKGYNGITLFPFIFLNKKELRYDEVLLNHEKIHLRQQLELLVVPFYLLYALEFMLRSISCRSWRQGYKNISFEREAYTNERDEGYLSRRKIWAFLKYLRR